MFAEHSEPQKPLIDPADLELIRNYLKLDKLWIWTSPQAASTNPDHRIYLRRAMVDFVTRLIRSREVQLEGEMHKALSELLAVPNSQLPPQTSFAHITLSHCPTAGGFAITLKPQQLGLDIEIEERVTIETVRRVSTRTEILEAPTPSALWVAKEASFKSLGHEVQPQVISRMGISNWKSLGKNLWAYDFTSGDGDDPGLGCVLIHSNLAISLASPLK